MSSQLHLSQHAQRSSEQAIGFLMQQAVENADCISLAAGLVDEQSLPVTLARSAVNEVLGDEAAGRKILQYGTTQGPEPLRRVFRSYLADLEQSENELRDLPLSQIFLTTGSQQLLSLITQALFDPGDICLVAAPTYFVFIGVLQAAGARIIPVKADENGMCPDALQKTLETLKSEGQLHRVRLVYVVSYFENPSGVSVSTERRPQLLRLTQEYSTESRILLLEDAAYRELRYDGEVSPSIWSFDKERKTVILAQTFSKSFSPGVRVGLGVLPADLVKAVSDLKGNEDFGSAHLNQHVLARVLKNGSYRQHVEIVRASYREKRNAMLKACEQEFAGVPGVSWLHPSGGMYVWMRLPDHVHTGFDSEVFRQATQVEKVMYVPGELSYPFDWPARPKCEMRLSFGVQSVEGIQEGIRRLARAVKTVMKFNG
ncbi:MAG: PLP-dependent aminotransferase family protein [Planctomycetaceae bacterium]|nr:PLP-dependent aminotransferase family protein [Planctomycetaceae bacterium]